jgi:hypothetical protein
MVFGIDGLREYGGFHGLEDIRQVVPVVRIGEVRPSRSQTSACSLCLCDSSSDKDCMSRHRSVSSCSGGHIRCALSRNDYKIAVVLDKNEVVRRSLTLYWLVVPRLRTDLSLTGYMQDAMLLEGGCEYTLLVCCPLDP